MVNYDSHGGGTAVDMLKRPERAVDMLKRPERAVDMLKRPERAVDMLKRPERAVDMLAYRSLIVKANSDYEGDAWLTYDRMFRRQAAANPTRFTQWGGGGGGGGSTRPYGPSTSVR